MNKYAVIGDIHGCLKTLKEMYNLIKDCEIYSVGDIIDKGPDSALCIDFVIENKIKAVKGNHERFFEIYIPRYLNGEDIKDTKWYNIWGGKETIESYKVYDQGKRKEKNVGTFSLYKRTSFFYKLGNKYLITHGFGLPYYKELENITSKTETAITCNRLFGKYFDIKEKDSLKEHNIFNVFGHDAFLEVYQDELFFGIDTGCVYGKTDKQGGKLSCLILPEKKIISVKVLDEVNYVFEGE